MGIKEELKHIICLALKKLNIDFNLDDIIIDIPKDKKNGDYATNIALMLAKKLKKSPMEIANLLKELLESDKIRKVEVASPGFINFFVSNDYLYQNLNKIIEDGKNYGKNNFGKGEKVNVEFVSANPTGTIHIGHARGASYGDSLSRILNFSGFDVTKEYYINDAGNQMNNLGISIKERYKEVCGLESSLPEDGYHGKEIILLAENLYSKYKNTKLEEENNFFRNYGLEHLINNIKKDLDTYRVNFDVWTSEQSLYDKGIVDEVITKLKNSNCCYIKEDALWLRTTDYGDEKDRVLIKSDGTYTYFLPDIAYHTDKFQRGFNKLINIFGADHHGYVKRLKGALEILNYDSSKLDVKLIQMVRLIENGEEVKMSKRTGKSLTLNDLIDEVGVNATRYFFASKSIDSQMDFNLDLAKKNSNDNPIYYIEYANARISSILKETTRKKIKNSQTYKTLNSSGAYNILTKLYEFEEIVISAATKRLPHLITNYVYDLAALFHTYYASEKIISEDLEYTSERVSLLMGIKIVINNALDLIGIIPREEM